jgi:hypothetical protein
MGVSTVTGVQTIKVGPTALADFFFDFFFQSISPTLINHGSAGQVLLNPKSKSVGLQQLREALREALRG